MFDFILLLKHSRHILVQKRLFFANIFMKETEDEAYEGRHISFIKCFLDVIIVFNLLQDA